jgi:hypothetical protein
MAINKYPLFHSKQFQLLWCFRPFSLSSISKKLHHSELLIGKGKIITSPFGGRIAFVLFMCTSAFSWLLQYLIYILNCSMVNPSRIRSLRKRE